MTRLNSEMSTEPSLSNILVRSEICLAESIGLFLVANEDCEQKAEVQQRYNHLSPQAQIYALHKRNEIEALRRVARDLETNTPRMDYTCVKAGIASGNVSLDSLLSELPIFWQRIRTLNERVDGPRFRGRPPKRELLHVLFMMREQGLLEDKRAERDGDWIISKKHNMMVPYQDPIPQYALLEEGMSPVLKGMVVVINQDPSSEWETEFWRKGGRIDQLYLRSRRGESPEQLRSAYKRRLIRRTGWAFAGLMIIVNIALFIANGF